MNDLSEKKKKQILETILSSKEFSNSPTSSILLRFLVLSTIEKKQIKETTIGMELFGDQFLAQNNSSKIRVNIYNLRKKLDHYYSTKGTNEIWRITIDKGQYYTSFEKNKNLKIRDYKKSYKIALLTGVTLAFVSILIIFSLLYKEKTPFWNSFFSNQKDTTLVIGDFFGFMAKTKTGRIGWNRDYNINSLDEFYAFQREHPDFENDVFPANYSYLTGMGPIATRRLTKLFSEQNKDFSIRFSTKSSYEEIKEHNSIYIGPTKNNNKFIQYFNEKNTNFKIVNRTIHYTNQRKNKDTIFNLNIEGTAYEYAIVSRLKGIEGTEQFLFFSDHDIGVIAAIEMFCNVDKSKSFKKQYNLKSDTFTALFVIKGKERTNLDLEILVVEEVSSRPEH